MKIFAGIIGNKVNVGLLADPAELEASRADLDAFSVHHRVV